MQVQYKGKLLDDGHLSIPKNIVNKLKINRKTALSVTVNVAKNPKKKKIMSYAGMLSDLTEEEESRFSQGSRRKSIFGQREVKI